NLGNIYNELGQSKDACQAFQQALVINPQVAETHYNFGNALQKANRLEDALEEYQHALNLNSNIYLAYNGIGFILYKLGDFNQSVGAYQDALKLKLDCFEVYNNLGNSLRSLGRIEEAIQAYKRALEIRPDYNEAEHNLGLTLLTEGKFTPGWNLYENRWKIGSKKRQRVEQSGFGRSYGEADFPQPLWDGSQLDNKSIVVWMEQGIGDHIMFSSLLPKLQRHAQRVLVESEHRLLPIFQRSFSKIEFFPVQSPPHSQLLDTSINFQSPIGSLPQYLLPDEDRFMKCPSYFNACHHKTGALRRKYLQLSNRKLAVGISWKSKNRNIGKLKSTSLDHWEGLLSRFQRDCFFINLQYGDVEEEIDALISSSKSGVRIYCDKDIDPLENLDDFSAQVSALDLVISTSNTTVHMAGALGKPVWTLLHYVPDWRWMLNRSDSPWYPSMTLFRPEKLGDWSSVFQQVAVSLEELLLDKRS
ncbi:TPA: tetratricopeptide repeat protein, partial [Candidatus Poribacteria bacterium]|nr:tetratricopeptide repeat protein [Candidatus Poribacteria bacterium]